eukprot:3407116-Pleurochrysis_carterae.AAC.1
MRCARQSRLRPSRLLWTWSRFETESHTERSCKSQPPRPVYDGAKARCRTRARLPGQLLERGHRTRKQWCAWDTSLSRKGAARRQSWMHTKPCR